MTNKKGFTMVELLGVIVILGILSVVAITSVRGIINKSKKEQVKSQGKVLMMAAESYMQANKSELPKAIGEVSEVKASTLKSTRYLKNDLKDSAGESCMTDSFVRVYKYSNTGYSYIPFIYCGDDRAPANPTIEGPNIKVKLIGTKDKDNGQTSTNYQNVSTVSVQINIESKELNEITYPIMSYSYSIGIAEDNPDIFREVYNSGTINGNGKTTIQIDRPITEYIDITKKNIIRIKVVAIDQAGGYKEETKLVEDLEEELQNASSVKDETRPKCKNITGAAEGNEWINAEAYQKRNKIRTIKTECVDGEGSQCIREYFNKSWPSDDQSEAEYSYIQVIDNAGNKSVEDEFVKADTCNKSNEENGCRVKINVDIKYPKITLKAYKRTQAGGAEEPNILTAASVYGGDVAEVKNVTIGYKKYNNLNSNGWMNKTYYPYGVIYKIKLEDTIHLASWKWETNAPGIKDRAAANYKVYRTGNQGENKSGTYSANIVSGTNCGKREDNIEISFTEEGMRSGKLTVKDKAGNTTSIIIEANLDHTKPTCRITKRDIDGTKGWYKKDPVKLTMLKSDEGTSGLDKHGLVNSNTETYNSKTTGTQSDTRGITWYCFVIDKAGNKGTNNTGNFKVDTKSPTCRVNKDGTSGSNGWYKGRKVDLSLETNDPGAENSGVENYTLTTSTTASYNKKDSASQDDTKGVKWYGYVRDNAGNTGKCNSGNFKVDRTKPTCNITNSNYWNECRTSGVSAKVTCQEQGDSAKYSGLNKCAGASGSSSTKTGLKGNTTYTVTDRAGNSNSCTAIIYSQYQTRYRTRSYTCNRCTRAGCVTFYTCKNSECGSKYEWEYFCNSSGPNYGPKCKKQVEPTESCVEYYWTSTYYLNQDAFGEGKCKKFKGYKTCATAGCGCKLAVQSCPKCGDTPGSWRGWTGWVTGGCSTNYSPGGSMIKQCDGRYLYRHRSNYC